MGGNVAQAASELGELCSEESEKSSENSDSSEAARLIRLAAEPRPVGDSAKSAIVRAARRVGVTPSRAKDIWYRDARRIDSDEMDRLRGIERKRKRAQRREVDGRMLEQLAALRARLAIRDAEFHAPDIEAIDYALRAIKS